MDRFSKDAREIFEHFKFSEFIGRLEDANLLIKVVQKVAITDLSPEAISNHDMGLVFEALIRRFAESSNETVGEHFTRCILRGITTRCETDPLPGFGLPSVVDRSSAGREYSMLTGRTDSENPQGVHAR